jgi:hypothetical protein
MSSLSRFDESPEGDELTPRNKESLMLRSIVRQYKENGTIDKPRFTAFRFAELHVGRLEDDIEDILNARVNTPRIKIISIEAEVVKWDKSLDVAYNKGRWNKMISLISEASRAYQDRYKEKHNERHKEVSEALQYLAGAIPTATDLPIPIQAQ